MRKGPGSPGLTWTSLDFAESKDVLAHVAPTCSSRKTDLGRNVEEGGVWDEVKAGWLWSELCVCISLLLYKMGNWLASGFVRKKKWIFVCERTLCTGRSFQHITDDRRASLNLGPTKELLEAAHSPGIVCPAPPGLAGTMQLVRAGFIPCHLGLYNLLGNRWGFLGASQPHSLFPSSSFPWSKAKGSFPSCPGLFPRTLSKGSETQDPREGCF